MSKTTTSPHRPVCVVQIGFAGSRRLLAPNAEIEHDRFYDEVQEHLTARLKQLPQALGLDKSHFLCGISQIAIGADTLFTRACRELEIPQRIFLPQRRTDYLTAVGSEGALDFTETERRVAEELLGSEHISEERVVSDSQDRSARFVDTNLAILEASDVIVCLLRAEPEGKRGGTIDLLERGVKRGTPSLEIQVDLRDGHAVFEERWHNRENFYAPKVPPEIELSAATSAGLPSIVDYCDSLKGAASVQANWLRKLFGVAAIIIITTHIAATALATYALVGHGPQDAGHDPPLIPILLGLELALLSCGFGVHQYLHGSGAAKRWAVTRLIAEISRSIRALGELPVSLDYLFALPFPDGLRPLLHTLNVLKLRSIRGHEAVRDDVRAYYLRKRLQDKSGGQLEYYRDKLRRARSWQTVAHWTFVPCSFVAITATLAKLLLLLKVIPVYLDPGLLGLLAIVLPVLAVGAVSLSAAQDLEARIHTYGDMLRFLERQERLLQDATSAREFGTLVSQTESRLLGENVNWFWRRSFTGVA